MTSKNIQNTLPSQFQSILYKHLLAPVAEIDLIVALLGIFWVCLYNGFNYLLPIFQYHRTDVAFNYLSWAVIIVLAILVIFALIKHLLSPEPLQIVGNEKIFTLFYIALAVLTFKATADEIELMTLSTDGLSWSQSLFCLYGVYIIIKQLVLLLIFKYQPDLLDQTVHSTYTPQQSSLTQVSLAFILIPSLFIISNLYLTTSTLMASVMALTITIQIIKSSFPIYTRLE